MTGERRSPQTSFAGPFVIVEALAATVRTISHAEGLLEQEQIPLEHACVSCALREDILPTLERLAQDGRWDSIVAGLPVATEAAPDISSMTPA